MCATDLKFHIDKESIMPRPKQNEPGNDLGIRTETPQPGAVEGFVDNGVTFKVRGFGEQLKQTRIRLDYTQEELASHLGVKRQTLSSWETGTTTPDVQMLFRLKKLAKESKNQPIDLGDLLGENHWDVGRTPLSFAIGLLQMIDTLGIRNVYRNRTEALNGFYPFLEKESESIGIVCSSLMGLIRVGSQKVAQVLMQKARENVSYKILMTHPRMSKLRETQETRKTGTIESEIWESIKVITDWGIPRESIRFYDGAPTVFLIFTPERMLLNPYTYQTEAFKTFTLEVGRTESSEDIYTQYLTNHFQRSWEGRNSTSISDADLKSGISA
jgi:transcriptional regulator with XRE-family HTH domain